MRQIFKIIIIIVIVIYLILFISYRNGYYIDRNKEKAILTEEKIKEYEEDLKNGIDTSQKDYVTIADTYDNNYTRLSLSLSKRIENAFDKVIKYFFKRIGATINE